MGTYNIPRNVKGESRVLMVFSVKGLIYTAVGAVIGLLFFALFSALNLQMAGFIAIAIFALIGFAIGTVKIPDTNAFEITRKTGGENIDEIIRRYIKFKTKNKKVYVYKEDTKDE